MTFRGLSLNVRQDKHAFPAGEQTVRSSLPTKVPAGEFNSDAPLWGGREFPGNWEKGKRSHWPQVSRGFWKTVGD